MLALGALVVVAGLSYYLGNKKSAGLFNAGAISHEKAATLILAYLQQHPVTVGCTPLTFAMNIGVALPSYQSCPAGSSREFFDTVTLMNQGYVNKNWTLAAKAIPYILDAPTSKNDETATLLVARANKVEVDDIANIAQNSVRADFSETNQLTPLGDACSFPAAQKGTASLQLYDDGWKVVGIN